MIAALGTDITPATIVTHKSGTALTVSIWYYLVYSFEMTLAKDTIMSLFLNNADDGTATKSNIFLIDAVAYKNFIAIETNTSETDFHR